MREEILKLMEACSNRSFSFSLTYAEAEGCYYSEAWGQGIGEWCEVKRSSTLTEAISRLTKRIEEKFP